MSIGERVRTGRKALHLSQEEVARRAGVSLNQVNRLERGEIVDPHFSTLAGLATALNMHISELVGEPAPLGEASRASGQADGTKGPDPAVWGPEESRPKQPMPESAGKRIDVEIQDDLSNEPVSVTITKTSFFELLRDAKAIRLTDEDVWQRLLKEARERSA